MRDEYDIELWKAIRKDCDTSIVEFPFLWGMGGG